MKRGSESDQAGRFLELLLPIQGELEAYCRRLIWNPQDVRDALHNALARAISAFDRYHEGTNFRAWMFKIVTHETFALNRKSSRIAASEFQMEPEELALLTEENPAGLAVDAGDSIEAWQEQLDQNLVFALRILAEEERATLLLRVMGGFKYRQIAETLTMPVGSVIGYLGRARKKMRLALVRRQFQKS